MNFGKQLLRTVVNDDSGSMVVTCSIGGQKIELNEQDVNIAL